MMSACKILVSLFQNFALVPDCKLSLQCFVSFQDNLSLAIYVN